MLRPDISIDIAQFYGVLRFRSLGLLFDQVKDPLCAGHSVLELGHYAGYLIERLRVLVGIAQETGELSHGERAVYRGKCARDPHSGIDKAVHKSCGRIRNRREECSSQRRLPEPFIDLIELFRHFSSAPECLHDLLVPDHLVDQSRLFPADLGLEPEHGERPFCDKVRHQE